MLTLLILAFLAGLVVFFVLGWVSKSGKPAGLVDGRLTRCPATPNCVCSEFDDDVEHFVAPLAVRGSPHAAAMEKIKAAVVDAGGTIRFDSERYLAATFTSPIFRFVDDLELRFDETGMVVHVRSASRVGKGDLGINRKRVEQLRKVLER